MTDYYLDPTTGDLDLTGDTISLITEKSVLARQKLFITLSTYRGEWPFNVLFGTPYLANDNNDIQLLGKSQKGFVDVTLKSVILGVDLVTSLVEFSSTLDARTRVYTLNFKVAVEGGEIVSVDNFTIDI